MFLEIVHLANVIVVKFQFYLYLQYWFPLSENSLSEISISRYYWVSL
jgi:hypothetical protein